MIDLYKYGEILGIINISIIISITIISILLYKVSKKISLLITFSMYFSELIVYYLLGICNFEDLISIEALKILCIFYLIKLIILILLQNRLQLKVKFSIFLFSINIANIFIKNVNCEFSLLIIIFTNIIILKQFILDKIKRDTAELRENKQKNQLNNGYIEEWDTKISLEYDLQNKYKDEITNLNYKISKSIEEADIPIFILNINKEYIYSNNSFKALMWEEGSQKDNIDILSCIQNKFSDSQRMINAIQNIINERYINTTINSIDNHVYRFICTIDIIEEQSMIICILNDITRSTIIQNKLKESEEKYKKLMDILNEGIIIHDGFNISYINSKAIDLFNLKELNKSIDIEDIKKNLIKKYRYNFLANLDLVKMGSKNRIVDKLETKYGKNIEFITTILKFNEKRMFISIAVDITELENALADIEQSEKTYKLLLHTLPEGIMTIESKSKKHSYLNESMIGILKKIGIENLNNAIKKYLHESEYGKFKKFTINSIEKIDIALAIIEHKAEENLVVIVRILDSEHKMQRIKEELNDISQKNKFKTEILYDIINDIKEPINAIYTINNLIDRNKEKYKSDYIINYIRLLKQNCYRLIRLSNNIEEVKKIENGKYNLNFRKCDIVKLIKQIVQISQFYAQEKGLSMKFSSSVNRKVAIVDVEKIEKIILNILSNAIKFTNPGGKIDIHINLENEALYISVKDTGIGIPVDKIDTIFESFEQVDRTLSRSAEGTGIGLYLVKKLSEIHDIKIEVESELGKGSEFKIIINYNEKFTDIQIDNRIYSNLSDNEKIEIEFSDIYFDVSS